MMNNNNSENINPNNNNISSVAESSLRRSTRATAQPALFSDEQSNRQNLSQYQHYPAEFYENDEYDDESECDIEIPDISSDSDENEEATIAVASSQSSHPQQSQSPLIQKQQRIAEDDRKVGWTDFQSPYTVQRFRSKRKINHSTPLEREIDYFNLFIDDTILQS